MLKFGVGLFCLLAWVWFFFCLSQPWSTDVLALNIFSVIVATGSLATVIVEDL
jgi:hypothetical protein